jgi:hypothetical protein
VCWKVGWSGIDTHWALKIELECGNVSIVLSVVNTRNANFELTGQSKALCRAMWFNNAGSDGLCFLLLLRITALTEVCCLPWYKKAGTA